MLVLLQTNLKKAALVFGTALGVILTFRIVGEIFVPFFYSGAISLVALYGIAVLTAFGLVYLCSKVLPKIVTKFSIEV